jgi:hypothetical protein
VGGKGEPVNISGTAILNRASGPDYIAHVFVFFHGNIICRQYQFNPVRPSPIRSATKSQSFRLSIKTGFLYLLCFVLLVLCFCIVLFMYIFSYLFCLY